MKHFPRICRSVVPYAVLLWAAGLAVIWWLLPVGPREGWQPAADEVICGFLDDGGTMVTVPRPPSGKRNHMTPETGPIRLWDIETGQLRASHFGPNDVFKRVHTAEHRKLLMIERRLGAADNHDFSLNLLDPLSGREVASFACHVPQDNVWWKLAPDGRTTAFITFDNDLPRLELREVASGRLLHCFQNWREPFCYSPDGRRLAASRNEPDPNGGVISTIGVFEVSSGRELCTRTQRHPGSYECYPREFSLDGELLLDGHCRVWEVATGAARFQLPEKYYASARFTPDNRHLVIVDSTNEGSCLRFFDVVTGLEQVDRCVPLFDREDAGLYLNRVSADGRLLLAEGTASMNKPSQMQQWFAKLPGLKQLGDPKPVEGFVLVETATGREIMRGASGIWGGTADGRYLLSRSRDEVYQLWDVPPRRPLWRISAWAAAWTGLVLLASRRLRRVPRTAV